MHGPGWPSWEPTWTFPIPVLDTIAMTLRPRRMEKWREYRTTGLAMWAPAGVSFQVIERSPHGYPKMDGTRLSEPDYLDTLLVPDHLRLMRAAPEVTHEAFAWWVWPPKPNAAAAFFQIPSFWLRDKAYVIGHEVGHCLGLSHRPAGWGGVSRGIMGTGKRPDTHDIDSVKEWYLP